MRRNGRIANSCLFFPVRKWAKRKTFNRHFSRFLSSAQKFFLGLLFPIRETSFLSFFFLGCLSWLRRRRRRSGSKEIRHRITQSRKTCVSFIREKSIFLRRHFSDSSACRYQSQFLSNSPAFALGFRKPPCPRSGKGIPYHRVAFAVRQSAKRKRREKQPPVRRSRGEVQRRGGKLPSAPCGREIEGLLTF